MARCSVGGRTDVLPTTVRGPGLYAAAASGALWVVEIQVFNTTTSAVAVGLGLVTTAGTSGTALTEVNEEDPSHTILGTGFNTPSTNATLSGTTRNAVLGAAIGSGIIWTFGGRGLQIPEGTNNGVMVVCPTGTAQHLDFSFVWDE